MSKVNELISRSLELSDRATQFFDLYHDDESDETFIEHSNTLVMSFKKDKIIWSYIFDSDDSGHGELTGDVKHLTECIKTLALEYKSLYTLNNSKKLAEALKVAMFFIDKCDCQCKSLGDECDACYAISEIERICGDK